MASPVMFPAMLTGIFRAELSTICDSRGTNRTNLITCEGYDWGNGCSELVPSEVDPMSCSVQGFLYHIQRPSLARMRFSFALTRAVTMPIECQTQPDRVR